MDFCDAHDGDYALGLPINAVLRTRSHNRDCCQCLRDTARRRGSFAETRYAAKNWKHQRRVVAKIEASTMGMDIRTVVTSLIEPGLEDTYEVHYCARGSAENLIKLHKSQLSSDRTSCRSANANQMRLILHTAANWLMWRIQQAIPKGAAPATAEFATIRVRLLKIAARVIETSTRIRVAFASAAQMLTCYAPSPTRSSQRRHRQRGRR